MNATSGHIWSFDIGTSSFGIAVRKGLKFEYVDSLLIPDGFASIDAARTRRRMWRTRAAHKAREQWLRDSFTRAGLQEAVLTGRRQEKKDGKWITLPGDYRLEREFPPKQGSRTHDGAPSDVAGAETCYCGAVLRIRLLQGQKLQPWQIFKALHNAIQKRGYDPDLPYKNQGRGEPKDKEDDAAITMNRVKACGSELENLPQDCRFPCFLEARKMGLWKPEEPAITEIRQNHGAESAKNFIFHRDFVEREVAALIAAAVKQLPALKACAEELPYGPARVAYASYKNPDASALFKEQTGEELIQGKATDWQGVLAQKIPNFDNRAVNKCSLIPRFQAAKAGPRFQSDGTLDMDSLLPAQVTFLMKLKNVRFSIPNGQSGFSALQIAEIYTDAMRKVKGATFTSAEKVMECFKMSEAQLRKWAVRFGGTALMSEQEKIEAPKAGGRSRMSKPALRIVRQVILSGQAPAQVAEELCADFQPDGKSKAGVLWFKKELGREKTLNRVDEKTILSVEDLAFLSDLKAKGGRPAGWEDFYLKSEALSWLDTSTLTKAKRAETLIGQQNNPITRHRLSMFWKLLGELTEDYGEPDFIAIEIIREQFLKPKKPSIETTSYDKLRAFQAMRRKRREEAAEQLPDGTPKQRLLHQLFHDQGGICLYCDTLQGQQFDGCEVDHIVPRSQGGPDAYYNYAGACRNCNHPQTGKGDRTPWQWLHASGKWDAYQTRVDAHATTLRKKKVRLLTRENAAEIVDRYQRLAETAWIVQLARALVCIFFDWDRATATGSKIRVLPGELTARIRRKYKLNSLLGEDIAALERKLGGADDGKIEADIEKKCRADKRHHALDAMVLSYIPQWSVNQNKEINFRLPPGVHAEYFRKYLEEVVPSGLCFEKPALEESLYGKRSTKEYKKPVATKRFALRDLGYTGINPVFQAKTLTKDVAKILDPAIRAAIQQFIRDTEPDADAWQHFCKGFRQPGTDGKGPLVKSVRLVVAEELTEYADLSKGDSRPSLRKGDRHRGYYLYADTAGKVRVRPVYVFQSPGQVRKELLAKQGREVAEIIGFFQSGCAVVLDGAVDHPKTPLKPGTYKLNTIRADGFVQVTSATGVLSAPISAQKLIAAGFERERK